MDPASGMSGGGQGECQLSGGAPSTLRLTLLDFKTEKRFVLPFGETCQGNELAACDGCGQ